MAGWYRVGEACDWRGVSPACRSRALERFNYAMAVVSSLFRGFPFLKLGIVSSTDRRSGKSGGISSQRLFSTNSAMADDPYRTLELDSGATAEEIRQAYFRLAHKYHPDHNGDDPAFVARFKQVQHAFEKLSSQGVADRRGIQRTANQRMGEVSRSPGLGWTGSLVAMVGVVAGAWFAGYWRGALQPMARATLSPVGDRAVNGDGPATLDRLPSRGFEASQAPMASEPVEQPSTRTQTIEEASPVPPAAAEAEDEATHRAGTPEQAHGVKGKRLERPRPLADRQNLPILGDPSAWPVEPPRFDRHHSVDFIDSPALPTYRLRPRSTVWLGHLGENVANELPIAGTITVAPTPIEVPTSGGSPWSSAEWIGATTLMSPAITSMDEDSVTPISPPISTKTFETREIHIPAPALVAKPVEIALPPQAVPKPIEIDMPKLDSLPSSTLRIPRLPNAPVAVAPEPVWLQNPISLPANWRPGPVPRLRKTPAANT